MTVLALSEYEREYLGSVRFFEAIDLFIEDMTMRGSLNSPRSEVAYRNALEKHAEDVQNRDPRLTNRDDVKKTLRRWPNPNSQAVKHSQLRSFYDWAMEEGIRKDNPARQVRRAKRRPVDVYRLTLDEMFRMWQAASTPRERRVISLGFGTGARNSELRGFQGRHFERPGFVWISSDIAKGGAFRWLPVMTDILPVVEEIRATVAHDEFVIPAQRMNPSTGVKFDVPTEGCSSQVLWRLVVDVAERAGIKGHVTPHTMRHAFGDHVARYAGLKIAQAMMGHANVETTEATYTGDVTLQELQGAMAGFSFFPEPSNLASPPTPSEDSRSGSVPAHNRGSAPDAPWSEDSTNQED